jgi:hypothetical protein
MASLWVETTGRDSEERRAMTKFIDICEAVWADNDALEDAKITLQAIKKADPETYD